MNTAHPAMVVLLHDNGAHTSSPLPGAVMLLVLAGLVLLVVSARRTGGTTAFADLPDVEPPGPRHFRATPDQTGAKP